MDFPQQPVEATVKAIIIELLNLLQTNIQRHCLFEGGEEYALPAYILGRLGVQPKTDLGMWAAELIPLGDEFQIPG